MANLSDLERVPVPEMLDTETGEMIARSDTPRVAALLAKIRRYEVEYRKAKAWANEALIEAMDRDAKWTLHYPNLTVTAPSPTSAEIQWDTNELAKLEQLLPRDRFVELLNPHIAYKPDTRGLHNAAKAGGVIAEIIQAAEQRKPARRYVSVKGSAS